jgi:hypothetical protein
VKTSTLRLFYQGSPAKATSGGETFWTGGKLFLFNI